MRILRSVVEIATLTMFHIWQDLALGGSIAGKFVGDEYTRHVLTPFQNLTKELLGCGFIPTALDKNIEHVYVLIDRTP